MKLKHLLACSFLACSGAGPLLAATEASPSVAIELVPGDAQWEVRYALPAPARELRFVRVDAKGGRASSWTAVDPALAISAWLPARRVSARRASCAWQ